MKQLRWVSMRTRSSGFKIVVSMMSIVSCLLAMACFSFAADLNSAEPGTTEVQSQSATAAWWQFRFAANGTRFNPYETILSTHTVGGLQLKWKYTTGPYPGVVSSPAVVNGVVYVGSEDKNVYALDANTGTKLWNYTTGANINYSSPAVVNGVVYIGSWDDNLYALNAKTGRKLGSFATGFYIDSSPAVANDVLYFGSADTNLYALNATTGAKLWTFNVHNGEMNDSPAVVNGVVYVSAGLSVYAIDATSGAQLWSSGNGSMIQSSPTVAGGAVYFGADDPDGTIYALNATTGAPIWTFPSGGVPTYSTPAVAKGIVYVCVTIQGPFGYYGLVMALNARTGAELWSYPTNGIIESSPAVANGVVYVGSEDNNVYALDASNGSLLWKYATGAPVDSSPTVVNGMLYVGSGDRNVYAFGLN